MNRAASCPAEELDYNLRASLQSIYHNEMKSENQNFKRSPSPLYNGAQELCNASTLRAFSNCIPITYFFFHSCFFLLERKRRHLVPHKQVVVCVALLFVAILPLRFGGNYFWVFWHTHRNILHDVSKLRTAHKFNFTTFAEKFPKTKKD